MFGTHKNTLRAALATATVFAGVSAHAKLIEFTLENTTPTGGLWVTPMFFGFHNGNFDMFDENEMASVAIENVAEGGNQMQMIADFGTSQGRQHHVLLGDATSMDLPFILFAPGEKFSFTIDLDVLDNKYLSFASMIVPSNDAFIGNDDPNAHELFDGSGMFNTGFEINVAGANIWDAGTEENDTFGAAFSVHGGTSTDTLGGLISAHPGLDNFIGNLPTGDTLDFGFMANTPIARITAREIVPVPEPSAIAFAGGGAVILGLAIFKRRRQIKTVPADAAS